EENEMDACLVFFDKGSLAAGKELHADIQAFIDDNYAADALEEDRRRGRNSLHFSESTQPPFYEEEICSSVSAAPAKPLSDFTKELDESFQQMLMRKIAESGEKPSDIYHRANISKAHFSKINCDEHYKPTKKTVCAFAIALKLSPEETKELLMKAGFALSHSSLFDVIIEYFIRNGNYDIFAVNEALFDYDQELLGV
ncbi:MAG: RNase III inhibitor, partial [Lachnospiraceae bacterium]|nr:RNase III inhibitor [Candidatus Hippenecus merdae]